MAATTTTTAAAAVWLQQAAPFRSRGPTEEFTTEKFNENTYLSAGIFSVSVTFAMMTLENSLFSSNPILPMLNKFPEENKYA